MKFHESRNQGKAASSNYDVDKFGHRSSTTDELVQILRQQATSNKHQANMSLHIPLQLTQFFTLISLLEEGNSVLDQFPLSGSKRPLSLGGTDQLFLEPRALPRAQIECYSISDPSALSHGVGTASFPYHHQGSGHTSESAIDGRVYPRFFQVDEDEVF